MPPEVLGNFVGQEKIIEDLRVHIEAARKQDRAVEHIMFYGPPGLGKTTLARIVANEQFGTFYFITGGNLRKVAQLESIINNLYPKDVFFIDEVHRLPSNIEELLYSPLQDFRYENQEIPHFTFVGATTSAGQLSKPFRDRIIHSYQLKLYSIRELSFMLFLSNIELSEEVTNFIAKRSRGVPRIAFNFLTKARNEAAAHDRNEPSIEDCESVFQRAGIDKLGLNPTDRKILQYLDEIKEPIGEKSLSLALNIDQYDLIYIYEPYLMHVGLLRRGKLGRIITDKGIEYVKKRKKYN